MNKSNQQVSRIYILLRKLIESETKFNVIKGIVEFDYILELCSCSHTRKLKSRLESRKYGSLGSLVFLS